MSTVKISELSLITQLNANTSNTLFLAVDIPSGVTGKFTGRTLARGLYSNEVLNVGNNAIVYENVIGQFSGNSATYLQINNQNFDSDGSTDYVASTNDSNNTNNYIDMGINGSTFSDPVYSSMKPYDGYVYSHGPSHVDYRGNLVIGTASSSANIVFIAGGTTSSNIVGRIGANIFDFLKPVRVTGTIAPSGGIVFGDGSTQTTSSEGTVGYANSAFVQANAAYTKANTHAASANSGAAYANAAFVQANASFITANTPSDVANSAALYANGAFIQANAAFLQANTPPAIANSAALYANGAFLQANAAFLVANTPSDVANSAALYANGAFVKANTPSYTANSAALYANGAFIQANAAFLVANTPDAIANSAALYANGAFIQANAAFITANTPTHVANSAALYANGAFIQANAAFITANTPTHVANSAALYANAAFLQANTPSYTANSSALYANGAFIQANAAFLRANTPSDVANSAALYANGAFIEANSAFAKANAALANSSGTFAGDLTITGNTFAQAMNTANFQVIGTANVSGTLGVYGVITGSAQVVLQNTQFSATESALTISASPTTALPSNDGYMLHISGKNGIPSRIVSDAYGTGAYSVYASRSARGTIDSPSAVQSGDIMGRFSANGYGTTKWQPLGTGRIDFIAAENFTDANTGSQIKFWNCPIGSNTLTNILTLNGDAAMFTGYVEPQKGFVYTPRVPAGNQTAITINYATDSMIKATLAADLTVSHSNFVTGKVVEMWLINTGGLTRTITHGISATNSTTNSTTFNIAGTSSAHLKFFSIDGDLANTFVSVVYS